MKEIKFKISIYEALAMLWTYYNIITITILPLRINVLTRISRFRVADFLRLYFIIVGFLRARRIPVDGLD